MQIVIFVSFLVVFLMGVGIYVSGNKNKDAFDMRKGLSLMFFPIILGLFITATVPLLREVGKKSASYAIELEEKAATYTIYLDGKEVDYKTIDLSLYKKRIDDENKVIYLTQKDNNFIIPIPFMLGR